MAKLDLLELRQNRDSWKEVNVEALSDENREKYYKRKEAVDLYIDGVAPKNIIDKTGIPGSEILRYTKRCNEKDKNGKCKGYAALIPNRHIKKSIDKLQNLFLEYPTLKSFVIGNYFGNNKYTLEHNMNIRTLHSRFLKECIRLGIQDYEYPFTLKDKGYVSLYRYIKQIELELPDLSISRENKDAKQKFNSTGYGETNGIFPLAPFSIVQLDGHKIDMLYTIEVENEQGELIDMPATRAWIIAVIDVSTRVVLGYSISAHENYNQYDVLLAIHNAIVPHQKMNFSHDGFKYPENGGFHSFAFPETQWATFDMIMLDNAKSHLAKNTLNKLVNEAKCAINYGSVATPETRGIVERFFKTLETSGFHRLPGTTGSGTKDNKRRNPEKESIKYRIKFTDICELIEYLIADYNNSAHSGLENQTPLQVMGRRIRQAGMKPYIIPPAERPYIEKLTYFTEERTLRGGYSTGTKPYVSYLGTKYHAYDTQIPMEMINQKVYLEVNPADVSHVSLYNKDGVFVANLVAMGEWGRYPHSIKTHQAALKRKNSNLEKNQIYAPYLSEYENELRKNAQNSRRDRTEAAIVKREQKRAYQSEIPTQLKKYPCPKEVNKEKTYTKEEMELINSMSIEEAYQKGLI